MLDLVNKLQSEQTSLPIDYSVDQSPGEKQNLYLVVEERVLGINLNRPVPAHCPEALNLHPTCPLVLPQ